MIWTLLRTTAPILALLIVGCGREPVDVSDESGTAGDTATDTGGTETGGGEESTESGEESTESGEETGGAASCGNGMIEAGEACDGDDLGGQSCTDLGFIGGELTCSEDCTVDATGCTSQECGNGMIEEDEECDGAELGGVNCIDLGFGPGLPMCADDCTFDTSTCPTLGEGDNCGPIDPCPNDLNCVSGTCYDGSTDDPCENGGDCQSGDCVGATLFDDGTCA